MNSIPAKLLQSSCKAFSLTCKDLQDLQSFSVTRLYVRVRARTTRLQAHVMQASSREPLQALHSLAGITKSLAASLAGALQPRAAEEVLA